MLCLKSDIVLRILLLGSAVLASPQVVGNSESAAAAEVLQQPQLQAGRTQSASAISLEDAVFRRVVVPEEHPQDPGRLLLYVASTAKASVALEEVFLNGKKLEDIAPVDADYLYWQLRPPLLVPGKLAELTIQLTRPPTRPCHVKMVFDNGHILEGVVSLESNPLEITFVGFTRAMDKAYIYVRNESAESLVLDQVWKDREEVSQKARILDEKLTAGQGGTIVVRPGEPFRTGETVYFRVKASGGEVAQAVVKVLHIFPVNLDSILAGKASKSRRGATNLQLRRIAGCVFHRCGPLPHAAKKIISKWTERYPSSVNYVHICRNSIYGGRPLFLFGGFGDAILVQPYALPVSLYQRSPGMPPHPAEFITELARKCAAPRPIFTLPLAVNNDEGAFFCESGARPPVPEEFRLMTYYGLAHGCKGLLYRFNRVVFGYDYISQGLIEEMVRVNSELQTLKEYLAVADVVPWSSTNVTNVEAASLLAGDKGLVLILINHDNRSSSTGPEFFTWTPQENFTVTLRLPPWFSVKGLSEVKGKDANQARYRLNEGVMSITVDRLDVAKVFLLEAKDR